MSQFNEPADFYVSQFGGDALNDGTDPLTPYAHPNDSGVSDSTLLTLVGPGVYKGAMSGNKHLKADGKVIMDLEGGSWISVSLVQGIHFKNSSGIGNTNNAQRYENCIFENVAAFNLMSGTPHFNNVFINDMSFGGTNSRRTNNSIFLGNMTSYLQYYNRQIKTSDNSNQSVL